MAQEDLRFRDTKPGRCDVLGMVTPKPSRRPLTREEEIAQAELEDELRQAERDIENGDFIELTEEQLDECIASGRWPWENESSE